MRYGRTKAALAIVAASVIAGFVMADCATVKHDPLYDGVDPSEFVLSGDSTKFVRLSIVNHRTRDLADPHFYLIGTGKHPLGIVAGMGTVKIMFVDTRWFGQDNCFRINAHWVGGGDWFSERVCYESDYTIDVALQPILVTSSAWAHP